MSKITIYMEIRSLIRQGKSNREIEEKLFVTSGQINYQRRKIREENKETLNIARRSFLGI